MRFGGQNWSQEKPGKAQERPRRGQDRPEEARGHLGSFLVKTIAFYSKSECDPQFYLHETRATLTKYCKY